MQTRGVVEAMGVDDGGVNICPGVIDTTALSQQLSLRLMLGTKPWAVIVRENSPLVY
ncbi:hypothetical protein [Azomonas macrocytogenes]|uniref:Uncharacterized protein n=1 Tax=Azomonas macrocytogenes TaxID=69962 RepID=A0A839T8Z4_AZOMA|nr:hypothetical protein [Azomonas macrocytogenes]MBB3104495.1 hypothetical protein [Azomonas macrocytogenes]